MFWESPHIPASPEDILSKPFPRFNPRLHKKLHKINDKLLTNYVKSSIIDLETNKKEKYIINYIYKYIHNIIVI